MTQASRGVRRGRRLVAALAAVSALGAAAMAATPADAAFTTARCQGAAITGQGATFPNVAHNSLWILSSWPAYCLDVTGTPPGLAYNPDATLSGSGAGRRTFGDRSGTGNVFPNNADGSNSRKYVNRFAGTDEVFSTTVQTNINNGSDAVGDEGTVHTIPIAVGSNAVLVNLPDGCSIYRKPTTTTDFATASGVPADNFSTAEQRQFSDFGTANLARLELTRTQLEGLFYGSIATWGALVPWINDGNGTAGEQSDTDCANKPVYRVVRFDSSGTTFAQKEWLERRSTPVTGTPSCPRTRSGRTTARTARRRSCAAAPRRSTRTARSRPARRRTATAPSSRAPRPSTGRSPMRCSPTRARRR